MSHMGEPQDETEMVERVEWMSPVHYEIINFYEEHDIWLSPVVLSKNIDYHRSYLADECRVLTKAGLLEKDGRTYRLTDRGRAFLAGDLDADALEDPTQ